MSNLVAIAYPDADTAQQVMTTLGELQTERSIVLEDAVIVTRDEEGKVKLHQARSTTGAGAAGGAMYVERLELAVEERGQRLSRGQNGPPGRTAVERGENLVHDGVTSQ